VIAVDLTGVETDASYGFDRTQIAVLPRLADFDGSIATVYAIYVDNSMSGALSLWRARVDLTATTGTINSENMMASDPISTGFAAVHSIDGDYIAYETADHELVLGAYTTGAFHVLGSVATIPDGMSIVELGIRDRDRPVSAMNPIAVAWASQTTVSFSEVTSTTPFHASAPRPRDGRDRYRVRLCSFPQRRARPGHGSRDRRARALDPRGHRTAGRRYLHVARARIRDYGDEHS
jgi:hypothetical protein